MIHEWQPGTGERNLGDALTELLADMMPFATKDEMINDPDKKYFLIGSVIDNNIIMDIILQGYTPVFVNCGWRGNKLSAALVSQCEFIGCRGPITQKALSDLGIDVDVTMDSAYLLRESISIPTKRPDKVMIVPHILSSEGYHSPVTVKTSSDIIKRIRSIGSSGFVLGGAMHACIIAHMYGVPFAPYIANDYYVDASTKWKDWLESIGIPQENLRFARTIEEGRGWYESNKHYLFNSYDDGSENISLSNPSYTS